MYHTEEEAKTKWCPFARVGSPVSGLGAMNRTCHNGAGLEAARCIASACMAWRGIYQSHEFNENAGPPAYTGAGRCGLVHRE